MRPVNPEPIRTHVKGLPIAGTLDSATGKVNLNPLGMALLLRPKRTEPAKQPRKGA